MNEELVGQIEELVRDTFSKSRSVSFKTDKTLDNLIKKLSQSLRDIEVDVSDDNVSLDDNVEKILVGRIEVTKIGEKAEDLHKVGTKADSVQGDEHSKKFHDKD